MRNISIFIVILPFFFSFAEVPQNRPESDEVVEISHNTLKTSKTVRGDVRVQETQGYITPETYEWDNAEIIKLPYDFGKAIECESRWKHYDKNGKILMHYNKNGTYDMGIGQVNSIHAERAEKLGYDLRNKNDNLKMALLIYEEQGIGAFYGYDPVRDKCSYEK